MAKHFDSEMNNSYSENVANTKDTILNITSDDGNKNSDFVNETNVTKFTMKSSTEEEKTTEQKSSNAVIISPKPLCADYRSDSSSDSVDSESDSTLSDTDGLSSDDEYDSSDNNETFKKMEKKKTKEMKTELSLVDLPPIENMKISVPENECVEIGNVTSIVDTLVVVESYKGTAALDVDTVLFLDHGKRPLGKIFDVLGPISEPVYTVRFNDPNEITSNKIERGLKVYFAPKTEHTSFVFLSEVMKIRGSDASWKDNVEAPPEFQDFSDDEEENKCKNKGSTGSNSRGPDDESNQFQGSRKRAFNSYGQTLEKGSHPPTFKNFGISSRGKHNNQGSRFSSHNHPGSGHIVKPVADKSISHRPPVLTFPHNVPYPCNTVVHPSQRFFPPRFSGPPFPSFRSLHHADSNQNFGQPFYQQRMPFHAETYGAPWYGPMFGPPFPLPPPPPPPPPPLPFSNHTFCPSVDERTDDMQNKERRGIK